MGRHKRAEDGRKPDLKRKPKWTQKQLRADRAVEKFGKLQIARGMYIEGAIPKKVAQTLKIPTSTAQRWKKKLFSGDKSAKRKVGSGRKRKTTQREDRLILKKSLSVQSPNASEICEQMKSEINLSLCPRTVRNRLHEQGYWRRVAAKKPFVSPINIAKRLAWGREHVGWTKDQWGKVIWSDESLYHYVFKTRRMVWRKDGEKFKKENLAGTVKESRKKEMFWGAFVWGVWGCCGMWGV